MLQREWCRGLGSVSIGVYRIYIGHGWGDGEDIARLTAALDAYPAFLYRLDRVSPEDLAVAADDNDRLRSAVRVAMTQSHVMLRSLDAPAPSSSLASTELDLARSGFRRRIPVLGVTAGQTGVSLQPRDVDCLVPLDASALVCAIQDKAEEAAAERRQANVIALARPRKDVARARSSDDANQAPIIPTRRVEPSMARAVPIADIVDAYQRLIASRQTLKN